MVIKMLYLFITGFLISISFLRRKINDIRKAFRDFILSTAWCFGVFGATLTFNSKDSIPPSILFYVAIAPVIYVIIKWILRIK